VDCLKCFWFGQWEITVSIRIACVKFVPTPVATSLVPVAVSGDRQPGSGTFTVSLPVFSVARRRNFIWVTVTIYAAATDGEPWRRSHGVATGNGKTLVLVMVMVLVLVPTIGCCARFATATLEQISIRSEQIDGNCRRAAISATFKSNFM